MKMKACNPSASSILKRTPERVRLYSFYHCQPRSRFTSSGFTPQRQTPELRHGVPAVLLLALGGWLSGSTFGVERYSHVHNLRRLGTPPEKESM